MDFTLDTEQVALRDAVREMVGRREAAPAFGLPKHDAAQWKAFVDMGLLGLPFGEEVGGMGAGPVEVMLVAEELGRAGVQSAFVDALLAGWILSLTGSDLVESVADGSAFVVPALAEPSRAWSLAATSVTAVADGDAWTLTGAKEPVPYAADATHVVVSALAGSDTALFLVEKPPVVGDSRIAFEGTAATLLGTVEGGSAALASAVNLATAAICAEALGAMAAATDATVAYLKTRKQFGVPLAAFQTLTHRAADLYIALELARSTVQFAAISVDADPADSASVSRAKVVIGRTGRLVGQEAIQLHGGIAMTAEYSVGHLTSRLTAIEHTFGDTRQHLASLAANLSDYTSVDLL